MNTSIRPEPFQYEFSSYALQGLDGMIEEELHFSKSYTATLTYMEKMPFLRLRDNLETLFPHSKTRTHGGVYFIYRPQNKLHYVGKAKVFFERFEPRREALRHLGIPDTCVQDVWVSWIIVNVTPPNDWSGVKTKGNKPVNNRDAVIRALERYFYFEFKKRGHPLQGNAEEPEKGGVKFLNRTYIESRDSKRVDRDGNPHLLFRINKDY